MRASNYFQGKAAGSRASEVRNTIKLYNKSLLALGIVLVLSSAAVITALYCPEHMPFAIQKIVEGLTPAIFYTILGASIFGAFTGIYAGCKSFKREATLVHDDSYDDSDDDTVEITFQHVKG